MEYNEIPRSLLHSTSLQQAIESNDYNIARILLAEGADVNALLSAKKTPLELALRLGNETIARLLIELGADVEACSSGGLMPLHLAIKNQLNDAAKLLIERGAGVNILDDDHMTPLHYASQGSQGEALVALLLNKGADIGARNKGGYTPLHFAIQYAEQVGTLKVLLDRGADVNARTMKSNLTPLHLACRFHEASVKFLLDSGADVNSRNSKGESPLHVAARYGQSSVVKLLLDHGAEAELQTKSRMRPIHFALDSSRTTLCRDIVELLLERGSNVNSQDANDKTPLSLASGRGERSLVELILNYKPDKDDTCALKEALVYILKINADDLDLAERLRNYGFSLTQRDSVSLFEKACEKGSYKVAKFISEHNSNLVKQVSARSMHKVAASENLEMLELLLQLGFNIDSFLHNESPLHVAANEGRLSTMKLLINHGADAELMSGRGQRPIHYAAWLLDDRGIDCVTYLLQCGVDINSLNSRGSTALHIASERCQYNTVRLLLDKGADVNIAGNYGLTALQVAFLHSSLAAEAIQHHIIKLKFAGFHVSQKNLGRALDENPWPWVEHNESPWLVNRENFISELKRELAIMKSLMMCESTFSLYEVFTTMSSKYTSNKSLLNTLLSFNYDVFPHCGQMIKRKVIDDQKRSELLEAAKERFDQLCDGKDRIFPDILPQEISEKILSYLGLKDLKILISGT